jgi:hypothetical protein
MKKLLIFMVLVLGTLVVNAQRSSVKAADLQKSITDNISKDYVGFTIKEASKVVENNMTCYEVVIAKGTTQETLCYDKDGKFMKKLTVKAGSVEKKDMKPVAHSKKKS